MKTITVHQFAVLRAVSQCQLSGQWFTPGDIGGRRKSGHSRVLKQLSSKGFLLRAPRYTAAAIKLGGRPRYEYRLSSSAKATLAEGEGRDAPT